MGGFNPQRGKKQRGQIANGEPEGSFYMPETADMYIQRTKGGEKENTVYNKKCNHEFVLSVFIHVGNEYLNVFVQDKRTRDNWAVYLGTTKNLYVYL